MARAPLRLLRGARAALAIVGLLLWVAVPGVAVWVLQHRAESVTLSEPQIVFVQAEPNTASVVQDINIAVGLQGGSTLIAPSLNGIVEQSSIAPGDTVANGQVVAVIGGYSRLAVASERPFGRALALNDKGADVEMLNATLSSLGYASGASTTYSASTARGVAQLVRDISQLPGVDTTGASFDPSWFFYLPPGNFTVDTTNLVVGAPAPTQGTTVATGRRTIATATLTLDEPSTADTSSTAPPSSDSAGSPTATPTESTDQPAEDVQPYAAPEGATLTLNGVPLDLTADRAGVSANSFQTLELALDGNARTIPAQLTRPPGNDEFSVPSAAIFTSETGSSCVLAQRGSGTAAEPVSVLGNTFDSAIVTGDLTGVSVAISPPASQRACA